ncbi:nucleotide exchange factor GrpE [Desulfatiglans anilini]|uniref:nucleotide exchange factor GrpE n=1 Tax=Desulfatiglans anilini TaxID=90728 RepID=UPI00041F69F3|nr:nucleotide exchange factor GrpE [Desulfatiglans anilini]
MNDISEADRNREASLEEPGHHPEPDELAGGGAKTDSKPAEEMSREELLQKLKEVQEAADKNFDLYLRSQAEIENLKKRSQKEKEGLMRFGNESLIKRLLPVVDNLETALIHVEDEKALEALREGVNLTLKGLKDALHKEGVSEVKALGEPFDPHFHDAISEQEDASVEPRTIIHELQKGYLLNDRLVRPATVVVSKKNSEG